MALFISHFQPGLRQLNLLLGLVLFVLASYIIIWPFMPAVSWWASHSLPVISTGVSTKVDVTQPIPNENTLFIPSLGLTEKIHEGSSVNTVHRGVWRIPASSTPEKASNTVLVGHRFTYDGASVFYNLDKVNVGHEIAVYWQGKQYIYIVEQTKIVPPTAIEVEAPTNTPTLTLYTCAPLLTAKNRLVIVARLVE